MKLKISLLFSVFVMSGIALAQNNITLSDFLKMSKDQKLKTLTSSPQIGEADQFLEVLITGVQDPDKDIQKEAMAKLAATMIGLQQYAQKRGSAPVSPSRITQAQSVLKEELSNPDDQMRGGAFVALAYSSAPNPDIESSLLNLLAQEQNDQLQGGIIETMGFAGYNSDKYVQTLRESILAPSSYVRDAAAKTVVSLKPPGMLPLLAQALKKKLSVHWYSQAMAAYGAEAQPYLPLLEMLAADPTVVGRGDIANAIAVIKNPSPQAAATPRIKAISLVDDRALKPPTPTTTAAQTTAVPAATPVQQPQAATPAPSGFPIVPVAIVGAVIVGIVLCLLRRKSP